MVREAWGKVRNGNDYWYIIDDFAQDCSISNELAVEILQSCTKPSIITSKKSFTFRFHRNMYLTVQLTSDHQLFRKWLGAKQVSSHYLIHCLSRPMGLNELTICTWNHARKIQVFTNFLVIDLPHTEIHPIHICRMQQTACLLMIWWCQEQGICSDRTDLPWSL